MLQQAYVKARESMHGASVVRDDGTLGKVVSSEANGRVLVEFNDGLRMTVTSDALLPKRDGSYRLSDPSAETEEIVIPVIAEELNVETDRIQRGRVRVHKRVEPREEVVDSPVTREEVVLEHTPINKFIGTDKSPPVREENGVLIIPVVEEVLVVEKRPFLRGEVRVVKHHTTTSTPQTVVLRREVVATAPFEGTHKIRETETGKERLHEDRDRFI